MIALVMHKQICDLVTSSLRVLLISLSKHRFLMYHMDTREFAFLHASIPKKYNKVLDFEQ